MMAARSESARRISDCVTALLRDQPFFGSLALRLPIRTDETRETLASDGKDIRYAPQWVADTDADHIKTALARVVLACALKHHTRRGGRDPERWQRASQLITHGLLRDAGFALPPGAEAWDGISAEQAYDRLPEPSDGGADQNSATPSGEGDGNGRTDDPQPSDGGDDQNAPSDPTDDSSPQEQDETGADNNRSGSKSSGQTPASHDPCGTGEVMDADERRDDATGQSGESPVNTPRRGAGVGRGHAPGHQSRAGARQRAGRRRRDDPASASQHPRLAVAVAQLHDRRRAPRLAGAFLTGASSTAASICPRCTRRVPMPSPSSSTPPARCRARRWPCSGPRSRDRRRTATGQHLCPQVDAVLQDAARYPAGDLPDSITIKGPGRDRFPAWLRMAP